MYTTFDIPEDFKVLKAPIRSCFFCKVFFCNFYFVLLRRLHNFFCFKVVSSFASPNIQPIGIVNELVSVLHLHWNLWTRTLFWSVQLKFNPHLSLYNEVEKMLATFLEWRKLGFFSSACQPLSLSVLTKNLCFRAFVLRYRSLRLSNN